MNRAKRYSGTFVLCTGALCFASGLYLGVVALAPKPEIREVIQSPIHAAATMREPGPGIVPGSILTAEDFNRHVAKVCPGAGISAVEGSTVPSSALLRCIVWAGLDSTYNREGQTPGVTPHPYVLHPGKTPLVDPTQDAYYRKLLKEGRFPTSGSSEGRPR